MSMESHSMMDTVSNRMSIVYERPGSDIQKSGCLKKLKTMKKKFFVLRSTSSSGPARLEYYDTEKKFKNNQLPKKIIHLHKCFNINKKSDTRAKNAIALYTNDDCFAVVAENSSEQEDWLRLLLEYQDEYVEDGQGHRQRYDYVWQVTINRKHNKGLGGRNFSVCGQYRVCLSVSQVCLVRNASDIPDFIFQLSSIRRCGHSDNFFFMEVGRQAPTGAGEILMQVDDSIIAQNMHEVILNAMKSSSSSGHDSFRQRSSTNTSVIARREALQEHNQQASLRPRTGSESRCQTSPRKVTTRPQSTAFQRSPNTSSEPSPLAHSPNPLSSPHMYENSNFHPPHAYENAPGTAHGHRYRSDSAESHGSRSSIALSVDLYGSSPAEQFFTSHRSVTPESSQPPITEESAYLPMAPSQRSTTPSPPCPRSQLESPGSSSSDAMEITGGVKRDGYIEMKPTGSVGSSGNDSGYMDMIINHHNQEKVPVENPASYMMMGGHHRPPASSVAVPMRQAKEGGYMDMAPSSQPLPTVKEGGSGEAYLPMTPTGMSPKSSMELRPAKVISYLSDDSMSGEFPKRAYSVGSRPVSKSARYHQYVQEPPPVDRAVTDNGRSSSAPHLIIQKIKNQSQGAYMTMDSSNLSCSPSVKSDDSDSFMELDFFYRPRTSSDSFGCRPRSSSFGKMYNVTQGHRPRSSSYGQSSRGGKHQAHLGSFESVRTTSKELLYKRSQESLSRFSTTSSKASSSESLRKGTQISDYVDMTANKNRGDASGYIDMTIGAAPSKSGTSRSSSSQSLSSSPAVSALTSPSRQDKPSPDIKVIKSSGHVIQKPVGFVPSHHPSSHVGQDGIPSQSSLFCPISFANASGGSRSPSVKGRSPASSGKESEEESYVPYEPGTAKPDHSADKGKENMTVKEDTKSSKKKKHKDKHDKHSKHGDKPDKGKKTDSGKKSPKMENVAKEQENTYIEYEPGTTVESLEQSVPHTYKQMHYSPKSDSRKPIQVSKSVDEKVDHSVKITSSSVGKLPKEDDNAYMDFNPAASDEKFQDPPTTLNTTSSTLQPSAASNNSSFEPSPQDAENNAVDGVQEAKDGQQSPPKSKGPVKDQSYQYMDFDPATHQVEKDDESSEVKSPTRVRSYIASGGSSMDAELGSSSSSSSLSSLANQKGGDERNDEKGLEIAVKSVDQGHEKQNIGSKESAVKKSSKSKWKKGERKDLEVKKVSVVMPVHLEVDDGYVGLDYSSGKADMCEDGSEQNEVDLLKPLPVKSEISFSSDGGPYKTGIRRLLSSDGARMDEVSERCSENRTNRKISAPLLGQYNQKTITNQRMSPARKVSVSSLNEDTGATGVDKDAGVNPDSLRTGVASVVLGSELQKQNSMPCMTLPAEIEQQTIMAATGEFVNSPRSRHSCSDLAGAYEQMNFPANNNLDTSHQQSSSQQQLAPPAGPQLNYASLDLGSSENVDDPKSPRIKSRHPSSADETTGPPLSYAEIDFKKSENLKNSGNNKEMKTNNKEVTFSLD